MILVICGMTCAGKDTAQDYLIEHGWDPIVSTTSRPIRPNEIEGKNYYFISKKEFRKRLRRHKFIEHRKYHTLLKNKKDVWYYGVEKEHIPLNKDIVVVLDATGYKAFLKEYGKKNVRMLWIELDEEERRKRNIARLDYDKTEFDRRNIADAKLFGNLKDESDFLIDNSGSIDEFYHYLDLIKENIVRK